MKLMACLLLATYPEANSPNIATSAVALAKQVDATLNAVVVNVDIPDASNALSNFLLDLPSKIREVEATIRKCGRGLLEAVAKEAAKCGMSLTTQESAAAPAAMADIAVMQARYSDLCLVGWARDNQTARTAAEAILFGSGRPVIMLPDDMDVGALGHVVVAWDGSRVAARAIAGARPLLAHASMLTVLTVTDEKRLPGQDMGERLAQGLRTRGLVAEGVSIQAGARSIGAALQQHSLKVGGNLLVMGGYGHSRVRDFVLGGATEGILANLQLPVLLSH